MYQSGCVTQWKLRRSTFRCVVALQRRTLIQKNFRSCLPLRSHRKSKFNVAESNSYRFCFFTFLAHSLMASPSDKLPYFIFLTLFLTLTEFLQIADPIWIEILQGNLRSILLTNSNLPLLFVLVDSKGLEKGYSRPKHLQYLVYYYC